MDALEDPDVIEVMLNPDGSLWIEKYGQDHEPIGVIPIAQSRLILSQVASGLNLTVNERNPIVEGEFPLYGSRFEGTFPPIVGPGPSFSLRKKASQVFTLEEYMLSGSITPGAVDLIEDAVCRRLNIVVVGGTSSGKTTFVNAVIDAVSRLTPTHRLIILEDTAELQSKSPNTVFLRTSVLAEVDMRKLAKVSMRRTQTYSCGRSARCCSLRNAQTLEYRASWRYQYLSRGQRGRGFGTPGRTGRGSRSRSQAKADRTSCGYGRLYEKDIG